MKTFYMQKTKQKWTILPVHTSCVTHYSCSAGAGKKTTFNVTSWRKVADC